MRNALAFALISLAANACAQQEQREWTYYEEFDYASKLLTPEDLKLLPPYWDKNDNLAAVRGIIFGKHGREFANPRIQQFLDTTTWYKDDPKFSNSMLNETERKNLDIVREAEAKVHNTVQPGDLRFWGGKVIPDAHLKNRTLIDVHIMRAEIEAIHGKTFPEEPNLQKYFEERYWYKPVTPYAQKLTSIETQNLKKLGKAEAQIRGSRISPGAILALGGKPLEAKLLNGLTLHELRLLRNEVYAAKGATFRTFWLQQYFNEQDWYSPLPEGVKVKLNKTDHQNLAVILRQESVLHEALSKRRFKQSDFKGMLSEDATKLRNEIYARNGKAFKDKWLSSYFASNAWYKPDSKYSDKRLSSIEKYNVKQLQKYESKQQEIEQQAEG